MILKTTVSWRAFTDGCIEITTTDVTNDVARELSRVSINTREEATRQALISLGWTPPKESKKPVT